MSYDNEFVPEAHVFASLSEQGLRDAVRHSVHVSLEDESVHFRLGPDHSAWDPVFDPNPEPKRGSDGIRLVELALGRPYEAVLFNRAPERLSCLDSIDYLAWRCPTVRVVPIGVPERLDVCPGLEGLLEMESARIALAQSTVLGLQKERDHLVNMKWRLWIESDGVPMAHNFVAFLQGHVERAHERNSPSFIDLARLRNTLSYAISDAEKEGSSLKFDKLMTTDVHLDFSILEQRMHKELALEQEIRGATSWAVSNGSERLKKAVRVGLIANSMGVYRDERLDMERPGWQWWKGNGSPRRHMIVNPSEADLDALIEAQAVDADATLNFWPNNGPIVVSEFLGRFIVKTVIEGADQEAPF